MVQQQQQQPPHGVPERSPWEGTFDPSQVESVLLKWVGHNIVLKYLGGPDEPIDQQDPKGLARGALEARSGIFYLAKYGHAGLEVARGLEDSQSERVTLIPWNAVLSIRGAAPEDRGGVDERIEPEKLAELSRQNDPT